MNQHDIVPLAGMVMIVALSIGVPLVRAMTRRWDRERLTSHSVDAQQLARIEQAIEAMAIEVERISEGQRFTTKLLSERASTPPQERGT